MATHEPFEHEYAVSQPSGETRWVQARGVAVLDAEGSVAALQGTCQDITERKRVEQALGATEHRAQTILERAFDAFVSIDSEGLITEWNPQAEATFGWSRSEAIGRSLSETIIPARYRDAHVKGLAHYLATGEGPVLNKRIEIEALRRDGREFPVELTISPVRIGDRVFFSAFLHDITDRKKAEERFRGLLESAPDAMVIVNQHGRIVVVNAQTEKLFGYGRDELIGHPVERLIPPRFRERHSGFMTGFFAGPTARPMGAGRELFALRSDGSEIPVEISLSPMVSEEGLLVTAAIRDITDRKAVEERIKTSLREKEALLKEVHHRVKNNMQIVSSLLRLQSGKVREQGEALAALRESEERVHSLALLHETLYRSGDLGRVNFQDYLRSLIAELVSAYDARRVALKVEVDMPDLDIDTAVPLGLLINELVTNAFKHAFPDGRSGEVRVGLGTAGPGIALLTVGDNGVGLPDDVDQRAKSSLGLQIVKTLSQQLKATWEFRRNGGTEFRLTFPL